MPWFFNPITIADMANPSWHSSWPRLTMTSESLQLYSSQLLPTNERDLAVEMAVYPHVCISVDILKTIELCFSNKWIVWCMNYISKLSLSGHQGKDKVPWTALLCAPSTPHNIHTPKNLSGKGVGTPVKIYWFVQAWDFLKIDLERIDNTFS